MPQANHGALNPRLCDQRTSLCLSRRPVRTLQRNSPAEKDIRYRPLHKKQLKPYRGADNKAQMRTPWATGDSVEEHYKADKKRSAVIIELKQTVKEELKHLQN